MKKILRVGAVPYLNAKPLIAGIEETGVELRLAVPSRLPDLLEQGELDVALIPSIEYLRGRSLFVIPDISIASRGAVRSVLLFLKVPRVGDIRQVALDESSLTSATLVRIILQERYGLSLSKVKYIPCPVPSMVQGLPIGQNLSDVRTDAVLVIGDNAMKLAANSPPKADTAILDLGAEWKALTGLPFVYALWATYKEELVDSARELLHEAKRSGLASLDEIAKREAGRLGLEQGFCLRYLSENIHYDLGEEEIAGLRRFYHYALSMDLAPEGVSLDFGSKKYTREGTFQSSRR